MLSRENGSRLPGCERFLEHELVGNTRTREVLRMTATSQVRDVAHREGLGASRPDDEYVVLGGARGRA